MDDGFYICHEFTTTTDMATSTTSGIIITTTTTTIDPCGVCHANASCKPKRTGIKCECNDGFVGNGYVCEEKTTTTTSTTTTKKYNRPTKKPRPTRPFKKPVNRPTKKPVKKPTKKPTKRPTRKPRPAGR